LLDYAGVEAAAGMQGRSLRPVCERRRVTDWRDAFYYRYWEHLSAISVCAHYGVRTDRYKLIHYYGEGLGTTGSSELSMEPAWELFDLRADPREMCNVYDDPCYDDVRTDLVQRLFELKAEVGDER
jgi:arylsulfatase A-like enzyme